MTASVVSFQREPEFGGLRLCPSDLRVRVTLDPLFEIGGPEFCAFTIFAVFGDTPRCAWGYSRSLPCRNE